MVKRYRDIRDMGGWSRGMEEHREGGYVRIEDYASLEIALRKIRDQYPVGAFRGLQQEAEIWRIADGALIGFQSDATGTAK